jgi:type I restriction enzyme S subunit
METQRLDAVADITMGQAPEGESYNLDGEGLPLIAGAGDFGELHPKPKKFTTAPGKTCQAGDVILGIRATIGEKVLADGTYCLGRGVASLRAKSGLDERYLWHWLTHNASTLAAKAKGATFKQVNREDIGELRIALPPLPEQRRIAKILDKADALRTKRRAALSQLDTLTQSIFLDMFGDPLSNPKRFPIRTLAEFYVNRVDGTKCGPFGTALKKNELVSDGIPVWNMDNIDPAGRMVLPFRMWIPERKYRRLEAYAVTDGDVIVSRAGTVGKMCVISAGGMRSIISTNLIRLRLGPDLLPVYFVSLMTYCKSRVGRLKTGADGAFTHMSTAILDTLRFPYPPLNMQSQFAAIAETIESHKSKHVVQLTELDTLFDSLRECAFRGAL